MTVAARPAPRKAPAKRPRDFDHVLSEAEGMGLTIDRTGRTQAKITCPCPGHRSPDGHVSLTDLGDRFLAKCHPNDQHAPAEILAALGWDAWRYTTTTHTPTDPKPRGKIDCTYAYTDEKGKEIYQVVRLKDPKGFYQRHMGPSGDWINNIQGKRRVLFRLQDVLAAKRARRVICVTEGEKDALNVAALGICATTNAMGAGNWRSEYTETLTGADVVILPDNDTEGEKHAQVVMAALRGKTASLRLVKLPDRNGQHVKDVSDWITAGGTHEELEELIALAPQVESSPEANPANPAPGHGTRITIDDVLTACRAHLYLPDTGPVETMLAAVAANKLPGDPVWLLEIAPPGSGKTEILNMALRVPDLYPVAVLTEASLLSGTSQRELKHNPSAKGGLLKEMGDFGILVVKDFGGVLSISKEARGPILAALREVYDGAWTRYVGSDGGKMLSWSGKAGLIGGATPSIDRHYAVMAQLGERFNYYRLPECDETTRARFALAQVGHETEVRQSIASLVQRLFETITLAREYTPLTIPERDRLVALATFATRCRSAVDRDAFSSREIELIPGAESPARFVKVLAQLLKGMEAIGLSRQRSWELVSKVAIDSMPELRRRVVLEMINQSETTNSRVATALDYPANTTRRVLEELACYGVVERVKLDGKRDDEWLVTDWTVATYKAATQTLPEILQEVHSDFPTTDSYNTHHTTSVSISGRVATCLEAEDEYPPYPGPNNEI